MMTLSRYPYRTMVARVAGVFRVDPGSEVVVEREGERKARAEDWIARSMSS